MIVPDWGGYLEFREGLVSALDPRFYSQDWLDLEILEGRAHFMRTEKAAIVFRFKQYPTGWTELRSVAATGDLEQIRQMLIPIAEGAAAKLGCKSARITSRPAWVRLMPDYYQYQVVMEKDLADGQF